VMSLKFWQFFDRLVSCGDKVRYGHEQTADDAARAMAQKGRKGLESYRCRYCDKWHIGHKRRARASVNISRQ
jgi:hypothetical protein